MQKNKDEYVQRFTLSAIKGELLERERGRERERERERGKEERDSHELEREFEVILIQMKYLLIHNISIHIMF